MGFVKRIATPARQEAHRTGSQHSTSGIDPACPAADQIQIIGHSRDLPPYGHTCDRAGRYQAQWRAADYQRFDRGPGRLVKQLPGSGLRRLRRLGDEQGVPSALLFQQRYPKTAGDNSPHYCQGEDGGRERNALAASAATIARHCEEPPRW